MTITLGGSGSANQMRSDLASTATTALGDALVGFKQSNTSGVLTGAAARTVHQKLQESVSILDFTGVDPTGATDSTAGIQAALNCGGRVFVPRGTYKFTNLTLSVAGTTLEGDGWGASKLRSSHVYADGVTPPLIWIYANDCAVKNLLVGYITQPNYTLGYVNGGPTNEVSSISIGGQNQSFPLIRNAVVEQCYIDSALLHGIAVGYSTNAKILHNVIIDCLATGIQCDDAFNLLVDGNSISNPRDSGIYAESRATLQTDYNSYGINTTIVNNTVVNAQQAGIGCDTVFNSIITGNIIDNTWAWPIKVATNQPTSPTSWPCIRSIVSNNIVYNAFGNYGAGQFHTQDIHTATGSGVYGVLECQMNVAEGLGQVTVSSNILYLANLSSATGSYNGLVVKSGNGVIVQGNQIHCYDSTNKGNFGLQIGLNVSTFVVDAVVSGNHVRNFAYGIGTLYSRAVAITGNNVSSGLYAFYINNSQGVHATGNVWREFATGEALTSGSTDCVVYGNMDSSVTTTAPYFVQNRNTYGSAVPTSGRALRGDTRWNTLSNSGGSPGWVCISNADTTVSVQANAGSTVITVGSVAGMSTGANTLVGLVLDDGTVHWTTIVAVPGTMTIGAAIPVGRFAPAGGSVWSSLWRQMANLT